MDIRRVVQHNTRALPILFNINRTIQFYKFRYFFLVSYRQVNRSAKNCEKVTEKVISLKIVYGIIYLLINIIYLVRYFFFFDFLNVLQSISAQSFISCVKSTGFVDKADNEQMVVFKKFVFVPEKILFTNTCKTPTRFVLKNKTICLLRHNTHKNKLNT